MKNNKNIISGLMIAVFFIGIAGILNNTALAQVFGTSAIRTGRTGAISNGTTYSQVQEQYLKSVNIYKNARIEFLEAKENYQNLKTPEAKSLLGEKSKVILNDAALSMIKQLETLRSKAKNIQTVSEGEKTAVLTELDKGINWLKQKQPLIENATPEQIKEQSKVIRNYLINNKVVVKRATGLAMAGRINFVIAKAENFAEKAGVKINELKSAGKDVSQLEILLDDINQKIALAKGKYESAKWKFESISSESDFNKIFNEGHQFIKDTNEYIRQAHGQLIQLVKEMGKL